MIRTSSRPLALLLGLGLVTPVTAADLVRDGKPVAVVALPPSPDDAEKHAARELVEHVEKMSGAKLETATVEPKDVDAFLLRTAKDGKAAVCLGRATGSWLAGLQAEGVVSGTFVLRSTKEHVFVAGIEQGTYFGVCELLEQQGVRWFMPGDLGTVIPERKTITVAEQETAQAPSFPSRWFQMPDRDWQARVRCGGPVFVGAHGIHAPPFKSNPELYARPLAENGAMRCSIQRFHQQGGTIYAECGGLMYACRELVDVSGNAFPMLDLLPARTVMQSRLAQVP